MVFLRALLSTAAVIVASWLTGCFQMGKYASNGSFFDPLEPEFGIISIDRGTRAFRAEDKNQNLIAVILWCPGLKTQPPTGSSQTDGFFVTTRKFWWTTGRGRLDFTYSWNRITDKVNLLGREYDRTAGNAFVVLHDASGDWSVRQISGIPPWDDARGVLQALQRKLPQDDFVAKLSVPFEVESREASKQEGVR